MTAGEITRLLAELADEDPSAVVDAVLPLLYGELRRIAAGQMRGEKPGQTLSPTALVHEAFIQLSGQRAVHWKNRAHFLGVAALAMRRVLLHAAEARRALRRGGGISPRTFDEEMVAVEFDPDAVLSLDETLRVLEATKPRPARVAVLKVYGGLNFDEIGEVLEISVPTVQRDWRFARAWLGSRLTALG